MSSSAEYGSWTSPISAADLAASAHPISGGRYVGTDTASGEEGGGTGTEVWWLEQRPAEGGRAVVCRQGEDGIDDLLPAPWSVRSRVHEYGGVAWAVTDSSIPQLVFCEQSDQRLYLLEAGAATPRPLSPAGLGMRFAELQCWRDEVIAVRERHPVDQNGHEIAGAVPVRDIVAVPLDGRAAGDADAVRSLVGTHNAPSDFYAYPRFSPDGSQLAWVAWQHPNMPWDATELWLARVHNGAIEGCRPLIGAKGTARHVPADRPESLLQPEWLGPQSLTVISDAGGFWNLHEVRLGEDDRATTRALHSLSEEIGGPLWNLGTRWYAPLDTTATVHPGEPGFLAVARFGHDRLIEMDAAGNLRRELCQPLVGRIEIQDVQGSRVLITGIGRNSPGGLWELDLAETADKSASVAQRRDHEYPGLRLVRSSADNTPAPEWLPQAEPRSFAGPYGEVHAFVYPPRHPQQQAPAASLPPYLLTVHGGPTGHVSGEFSLMAAYFTSRGIGVIDVNYSGSTGYGRDYRERLRGQWGVVDVADVIAAARGLAAAGLADPNRIAIRGGSAGGWTVLSALTCSEAFAAGISRYGVADLKALAQDTHDFEARYLDSLVGPLPEAEQLYHDRAPINRVDRLRTPVLLLQGLDDPVVPPSQSEAFRDACAAAGIPHAYVGYPGEAHGFRQSATIVHALESELSFLGQVLGFDTPGIPTLPISGHNSPH